MGQQLLKQPGGDKIRRYKRSEREWRAFSEHGKVTSLRNFQEWNRDIFKGVSPFQEEIMDKILSNDLEKK